MNRTGLTGLPGFLLSGFLFALLGALLPAWGHHLDPGYSAAANYFLALGSGVMVAGFLARYLKLRVSTLLMLACGMAWSSMLFLAVAGPPMAQGFRFGGWMAVGLSAGLLHVALFDRIHLLYQNDPASTVGKGGVFFGLGCLLAALLVAGTFYLYSVTTILGLASLIPAFFFVVSYWRFRSHAEMLTHPPEAGVFRDFMSPGAVLFALLIFFQSGNEWSLAGWLPIYMIRRMGLSPQDAIWTLAIYWVALLLGRLVAVALVKRVRHSRLQISSAGCALLGCVILMLTPNRLGATVGAILCGLGFAAIYPLVVERIGRRFPYYHPGVFNSIFSIALAGGMLAPWMIGILADAWGAWVVMGLPVAGTFLVMILVSLIWLETKVTGL